MAIQAPGKRWGPRLARSHFFSGHHSSARKSTNADLLITPLVDMFVIIVLFLIANFSATGEILNMTKDVQLPSASHVKELELAPVVMVTSTDVIMNGMAVARVSDLSRDDYLSIPVLEERLREEKKQTEELHTAAADGRAFTGDVNIQGHKEIPFKVLKRVMFSCQNAGYGNINFAVLDSGSGKGEGTKTAELVR
jgi:biopolymer transport protein ExbD